jgi:hypothetical protein
VAETTELAINASGFDNVITSIDATTKASKEFGETFKKAFLGEVARLEDELLRVSRHFSKEPRR